MEKRECTRAHLKLTATEIQLALEQFFKETGGTAPFAVASFLLYSDQDVLMSELSISGQDLEVINIGVTTNNIHSWGEIEWVNYDGDDKPGKKLYIIWVEPSVTQTMPIRGLENICMAIHPPYKTARVLDPKTGLVVTTRRPITDAELEAHRRWLAPSIAAGNEIKEVMFRSEGDGPDGQHPIESSSHSDELYILALLAYALWPGCFMRVIPVARDINGHFDHIKWLDAALRLRAMGLAEISDKGHKLTERGNRAFGWMKVSSLISLEVACLLAQVEETTDNMTKLTLVHLADVLITGMDVVVNTMLQDSEEHGKFMLFLKTHFAGHASGLIPTADVWISAACLEWLIRNHSDTIVNNKTNNEFRDAYITANRVRDVLMCVEWIRHRCGTIGLTAARRLQSCPREASKLAPRLSQTLSLGI